jgi:two-component system, OmpR family, response regulator
MRILVVEDDAATARLYRLALEEDGYAVDIAPTGETGRLLAATEPYDGIILDLGLRDRGGLSVLQELRQQGIRTPVLVCTGQREVSDVVRGLDAGADEYVTKPVAIAELRARVRALVRRGTGRTTEQLAVGNLVLNRLTRELRVSGVGVLLTNKEFALLEQLLERAGEVVTRTALLEKVWDLHFDPGSNVVDVHVGKVRRKLAAAGASVTVDALRGVGFILRPSPNGAG